MKGLEKKKGRAEGKKRVGAAIASLEKGKHSKPGERWRDMKEYARLEFF